VIIAALPRLGWIGVVGAIASLLAAQGRAGAAVTVGLAGLMPVGLLPRHRTSWPLGAAAAALGVVSLAGAWPALAGRARTAWERIGLGAVGWIWTAAAGVLAHHALYTRPPASVGVAVITPGLLGPAVIWAAGAALVPWISRRSLPLQVVLASAWAGALASGTTSLLQAWAGAPRANSGVVALGAVGGWLGLLAPAMIRQARGAPRSTDTVAGLA
jgi:hypothetical protein